MCVCVRLSVCVCAQASLAVFCVCVCVCVFDCVFFPLSLFVCPSWCLVAMPAYAGACLSSCKSLPDSQSQPLSLRTQAAASAAVMPSVVTWMKRRLQNGREYIERSLGRHGGAHQEAAYESERPASYKLTRALFLQLLGGVYLIAFASHFVQFEGLYGCDGILPVRQQLEMAKGLHWTLYPTLVRLHDSLDLDVYWVCNLLSVYDPKLETLNSEP
jgi:hypothetical protein